MPRSPNPLVDLLAQVLHLAKSESHLVAQRARGVTCGKANCREHGILRCSEQAPPGLLVSLTVNGVAAGAGQLHQPLLDKLVLRKQGRVNVV